MAPAVYVPPASAPYPLHAQGSVTYLWLVTSWLVHIYIHIYIYIDVYIHMYIDQRAHPSHARRSLMFLPGPRGCGISGRWVCKKVARAFSMSGACFAAMRRGAFPRGASFSILSQKHPLRLHRGNNVSGAETTLL